MPPKKGKRPVKATARNAKTSKASRSSVATEIKAVTTRSASESTGPAAKRSKATVKSSKKQPSGEVHSQSDTDSAAEAFVTDEHIQLRVHQSEDQFQGAADESSDEEVILADSQEAANNNAAEYSSGDEDGEIPELDSSSCDESEVEGRRHRSPGKWDAHKIPPSIDGDAYAAKLQRIVEKRGYVDARDLKKLNKLLSRPEPQEPRSTKKVHYADSPKPKGRVGGGDRERGRKRGRYLAEPTLLIHGQGSRVPRSRSSSDVTIDRNAPNR